MPTSWRYNPKLGRWYHPTGISSSGSPEIPPEEPTPGWGDRVAEVIKVVSRATVGEIKECRKCLERREWLNRLGKSFTQTN